MSDWKGTQVYIEIWIDNEIVYQKHEVRLDTDTLTDLYVFYPPHSYIYMIYPDG